MKRIGERMIRMKCEKCRKAYNETTTPNYYIKDKETQKNLKVCGNCFSENNGFCCFSFEIDSQDYYKFRYHDNQWYLIFFESAYPGNDIQFKEKSINYCPYCGTGLK